MGRHEEKASVASNLAVPSLHPGLPTNADVDATDPEEKLTRQGVRTRRALIRAARRVLERRGYYNTRIADITKSAGTSIGSFYTYFKSKEEIFLAVLIDVENEVYKEPSRLDRDAPPRDRIRETNELYLKSFQRNAGFWASLEAAALSDKDFRAMVAERHRQSQTRAERAFRTWKERGVVPPDVDVTAVSVMLGAMTERCAFLWFVYGHETDLDRAAEDITSLWLRSLKIDDNVAGRPIPRRS